MKPYTVIDSDDYKAAGIQAFFFPGGEPHVRLPDALPERVLLFLKLRTWNDVGLAACLLDALGRNAIDFETFIPYFPGARQDRSDGRTPLTADLMIDLLVTGVLPAMFDPHSHVVRKYAESAFMPSDLKPLMPGYDGIVVPDEGAMARAEDFANYLGVKHLVQCDKKRDFKTGFISGYHMPALPKGGRYLIVDDICDGGATFNMLSQEFHSQCTGSDLDLWVSHGIFSKGVTNIDSRIKQIFTTDSWYRTSPIAANRVLNARVKDFSLAPLFDKIMES